MYIPALTIAFFFPNKRWIISTYLCCIFPFQEKGKILHFQFQTKPPIQLLIINISHGQLRSMSCLGIKSLFQSCVVAVRQQLVETTTLPTAFISNSSGGSLLPKEVHRCLGVHEPVEICERAFAPSGWI